MIVLRAIHNTDLEIKERMAVQAFILGAAKKQHYDLLLDLTNMLIIAGSTSEARKYGKTFAECKVIPTLETIKRRFDKTGTLGVSAFELVVLKELVEFSKQFWNRQPIDLYRRAGMELKAYYAELAETRRKERENDRSEAGVGNS